MAVRTGRVNGLPCCRVENNFWREPFTTHVVPMHTTPWMAGIPGWWGAR